VEPQRVVADQAESADGCHGLEASMWSVPVVAVEPSQQLAGSAIGVRIGLSIGPFAQRGLD
jgi:hypothetical protein